MNTRAAAAKILNSLPASGQGYELATNAFVNAHDYNQSDRDFIYLLVRGVIQYKRLLDYLIDRARSPSKNRLEKLARQLLRVGALQIAILKKPIHAAVNETVAATHQLKQPQMAPLINGVLRHLPAESAWRESLLRLPLPQALAIEYSHPDWLVEKWLEDFGAQNTIIILQFNNEYQKIFFRHNPFRIGWDELEKLLQVNGYRINKYKDYPIVFFNVDRPGDLLKSEIFQKGYYSVQDYSQALAVYLLDPQAGENILDACAAPGGKATLIAQLTKNQANILANDYSPQKIALIQESACRLGIDSLNYSVFDASVNKFAMFDKILVDAPCSGTGALSRRADLRWNRQSENLRRAQVLQARILDEVAGSVREKGVLVYSTCSIEKEENWTTVKNFLEHHPEFSVDPAPKYIDPLYCDENGAVCVLPFKHNLAGSFAVRLLKTD